MVTPLFLLDSCVFIEAAKRYYAFDLAPGFWDKLMAHAKNEDLFSIDRVKKELEKGRDELTLWAKKDFSFAFASTNNQEIINQYSLLMNWANLNKQYKPEAKAEFADDENADAWLLAYAKAKNVTIVTEEQLSLDAKGRIPIPNVCKEFGIPYINTFGVLRKLGVRLIV